MTLDQLRYFSAVCKYGSVSQGAESLNISQPSVSNAIANLERSSVWNCSPDTIRN